MARQPFSARSGRERIGGWAAVGLILLPAVIGGLLTWGLSAPTAQLERVTAAIVNDDVAVTVNGKSVPLGRQFAAGLIAGGGDSVAGGSSETGSGTAASAPAASVDNFTWVLTNDREAKSGLVAGRYAAVVTIPSTFSALATSISGPAADAKQAQLKVETSPSSAFIDPALTKAVTEAATASLNRQLISQYLGNVYGGFNTINQQIAQAASGAASLSTGASSVASGAQSLASGASSLASGLSSLDAGAASLANGLGTLDAASQSLPAQTSELAQGAGQVASATDSAASALSGATDSFAAVVAQVCQTSGPVCDRATAALARLRAANSDVVQLSAGADQVAAGNQALAAAMPQLVAGIGQSAAGASQVASGAAQADAGGASLSSGAAGLAQGAAQLDSGEAQLAQSLAGAVQKIPTYSDSDIAVLSSVVPQPVAVDQRPPATGSQSVPLFCVVALWIGGLVIALARKPVPSRQLMTSVPSRSIAARTLAVGALLGAAQGLVTSACLLLGLGVGPAQWFSFVGLALFAGATFAVVNQGLAAAFGAVGRLIAVVIAVVALGVGLASTVPPVFSAIATLLPTSPALAMLRAAAVGDSAGAWLGAGGCLIFTALGALLVFAGIASRRGARASELSPPRAATRAGTR